MSGDEAAAWERREDGQSLPGHRAEGAQNGDAWKQEHVAGRGVPADPYWSTKVPQALCTTTRTLRCQATPRLRRCLSRQQRGSWTFCRAACNMRDRTAALPHSPSLPRFGRGRVQKQMKCARKSNGWSSATTMVHLSMTAAKDQRQRLLVSLGMRQRPRARPSLSP
jgi:hypothetical protein